MTAEQAPSVDGLMALVNQYAEECTHFYPRKERHELRSAIRDYASRLAGEDARDAKRYRHMRANAAFQDRNGPGLYWYLPRWDRGLPIGERLDNALDAAIAQEGNRT